MGRFGPFWLCKEIAKLERMKKRAKKQSDIEKIDKAIASLKAELKDMQD